MFSRAPTNSLDGRVNLCSLLGCLIAIGLLCGCGQSVNPKARVLVGEWTVTRPESVSKRLNQGAAGETPAEVHGNPTTDEAEFSEMRLLFRANGGLETRTRFDQVGGEKKGTWKFVVFDAAKNVITIECYLNQQTTQHEVEVIDERTISLNPPNLAGLPTKLTYQRVEPSKGD